MKKRYSSEQIVVKLPQADVGLDMDHTADSGEDKRPAIPTISPKTQDHHHSLLFPHPECPLPPIPDFAGEWGLRLDYTPRLFWNTSGHKYQGQSSLRQGRLGEWAGDVY